MFIVELKLERHGLRLYCIASGDENIEFLDSATATGSASSSFSAADLEEEEETYA